MNLRNIYEHYKLVILNFPSRDSHNQLAQLKKIKKSHITYKTKDLF